MSRIRSPLAVIVLAAAAHAQVLHEDPAHDPPAALPGTLRLRPPADPARTALGRNFMTQVNVSATGQNIVGDAANEPSLAVDPTNPNNIVIGWRQFDSITSNFREAGWAWSADAGRSWTFPGVLQNNVFRSDPVVRADAAGTFYYYSLQGNFTCDMFRSYDGGRSWSAAVPAFGGDKQWLSIDRLGGPGFGLIYGCWSNAAGPYTAQPFTRSRTGGVSFEGPYGLPDTPVWGTHTITSDSTLYIAGINEPAWVNSTFIVAKSTNAYPVGNPAFTLVNVNMGGALVGNSGLVNPVGLLGQVWIVSNPAPGPYFGELYLLASVDPPGADPLEVHFVRSTDGGQTWSAPLRINDDPPATNAYQWFGTLAIAPGGRLDVIWNDTRGDPTPWNPTFSELYYATSFDGGRTWSANVPLSAPFNHYLGYPQQQKLGDYYDMESDNVGANVAFAATFNGEQDVYFLRIGDFDCNANEVGDADDLAAGTSSDLNGNGIPDECDRLGDLNCDGATDFGDINPFVLALTDPGAYAAAYPGCPLARRDINGDGVFGFADINPFVLLLTR